MHTIETDPKMLTIRVCETAADFGDVQDLHKEIWGLTEIDIVPIHILMASEKSGGLVALAYSKGRAVGFVYGMIGVTAGVIPTPYVYIHNLGVLSAEGGRGVGFSLMKFAAAWALDRGLNSLRWAFDPMIAHNAALYIGRLGAHVLSFERQYWGEMKDELNQGQPSDRLLVEWLPALDRRSASGVLEGYSARDLLQHCLNWQDLETDPIDHMATGLPYLIAVPGGKPAPSAKRDSNRDWRLDVGRAFEEVFRRGLNVVGFERSETLGSELGFYVVAR